LSREVRVGLMFTLALIMFGTALYFLGNLKEMVSYKIKFHKVNGLQPDSPVEFRGVPIGRVTRIELDDEINPSSQVPIIVFISVHRTARNHLRTSTIADIRSVGILGDKTILLMTNEYASPVLEEDDFIQVAPSTLDVDKLIEKGEGLFTDFTTITTDLRTLLEKMTTDKGTLNTLISDEAMAKDLKATISGAVSYMEQQDNLLALLMKDPEFAHLVETRVGKSLANVEALTGRYRNANGLLPMLLEDQAYRDQTKEHLDNLFVMAEELVQSYKDGKGLAHVLTQDEAYGKRVSENLEKASFHLSSILEKIDTGDGTASLVVNDPSLYAGLYEVVYGLQHSGLSKWYIQRKQKKGAALKSAPQYEKEEKQ